MGERRFQLGRAFAAAFKGVAANALTTTLLAALLVAAPMTGVAYYSGSHAKPAVSMTLPLPPKRGAATLQQIGSRSAGKLAPIRMYLDGTPIVMWLAFVMPLGVLFNGLMTLVVLEQAARAPTSLRERLTKVLRRIGPLLLIEILTLAMLIVGAFVLLVPAAFVAAAWAVARPAALAERTNPIDAIRRSWRLTRPHRWSMAAMAVLYLGSSLAVWLVLPDKISAVAAPLSLVGLLAKPVAAALLQTVTAAVSTGLYLELARTELGVVEQVFG